MTYLFFSSIYEGLPTTMVEAARIIVCQLFLQILDQGQRRYFVLVKEGSIYKIKDHNKLSKAN